VEVLVVLDISEDDDVLIVNRLTLVAILVARLHYEDDELAALGVEPYHVAGLVKVGAILASLEERLAVIMVELDFVTIFYELALAPFHNFLVVGNLLSELFV